MCYTGGFALAMATDERLIGLLARVLRIVVTCVMAAFRRYCWECGTAFYGRADARYCRGGCRQKAYGVTT